MDGPMKHEHYSMEKLAIWVLLASECFLFGTLMALYILYKDAPRAALLLQVDQATVATMILILSSVSMAFASLGCEKKDSRLFRGGLGGVLLLGTLFLFIQYWEYRHLFQEGLTFSSSVFASSFYVLTGCHGLHVLLGLLWIGTLFISSFLKGTSYRPSAVTELAGLYWHFVDLVWILIFTLVYLC